MWCVRMQREPPFGAGLRPALTLACACLAAASLVTTSAAAGAGTAPLSIDRHGGFIVGRRPLFLVGLSNPPPLFGRTPAGVPAPVAIARAGVNLVRIGPAWTGWTQQELGFVLAWNRVAMRLGLHTWVRLNTFAATHPHWDGEARLAAVVHALTSSSAAGGIGLWQGADEPWSRRIPAHSLSFFYCRLTGRGTPSACAGKPPLDTEHQVVTILAPTGSVAELAPYRRVTDGLGVDVYPVTIGNGNPDLHQVGIWTRRIAGIGEHHFVWTTLQICSVRSYNRHTGAYVLPSAYEERYMLYDAIINGARGVSFFGGKNPHCWNRVDRRYGWNWTFWSTALEPLIRQIGSHSALAPALADVASNHVLAANDPTTEAISRRAVTPSGGQLWAIAARSGPGIGRVTITGLPAFARSAAVYGEGRRVPIVDGTLTDTFRRWQVHVYRVTPRRAR
jgi:hypothetical protein